MRDNKLIQFYLTNKCNSRCKTCHIWTNTKYKELDYRNVIEVIKQNNTADFVFGGGEFTLYTQGNMLLDYCKNNDINYTILSNCIDIKKLSALVELHKPKNITISCDGIRHDEIRGIQGNLNNIVWFVREYRDKIENLKISYTYSSLNSKNLDSDMRLFYRLGFDKVYLCIAQDMELLKSNTDSIIPSDSDIKNLLNYEHMLYDRDIKFINSICFGEKKPCDSTSSVFTVYNTGDVVRCQSFKSSEKLGNINEKSFNEIISSSKKLGKCPYDKKCNLLCQRRYD